VQETNGASNFQVRKWRANAITNYTFPRTSKLRGFGVGGGARFQDRIFLGYQGKTNPADPGGALIADPGTFVHGMQISFTIAASLLFLTAMASLFLRPPAAAAV